MGFKDLEENRISSNQNGATWVHQSLAQVTQILTEKHTPIFQENSVNWRSFLFQVKIKVMKGHSDSVNSCKFCFNDEKIVTSSNDLSIRLWVSLSLACADDRYLQKFDLEFTRIG